MSRENVEIVREAVEAFNDGNFEAAIDRLDPNVEWQPPDVFPDAGMYRGPEGVREFFEAWLETFQGLRLHLERCVSAGDQQVLAALRVSGEGAESGAWVESPVFFQLFEFREGLVIRAWMFSTETHALEAAGPAG